MEVSFGEGLQATISVNDFDEPNTLASKFCALHALNDDSRITLATEIREKMLLNNVQFKVSGTDKEDSSSIKLDPSSSFELSLLSELQTDDS